MHREERAMLKAVITSPASGAFGVTFETTIYGKPDHLRPSFYLPCAGYEHADRVAKAYNGVAFTEDRAKVGPPVITAGRELNHHGEPVACGLSRAPVNPLSEGDGWQAPMSQYRGAPMGIADFTAPDVTRLDVLHFGLRRVKLDDGGYDTTGIYWGLPQNTLWQARAEVDGSLVVSRWFRAPSYAHAVGTIRGEFPKATTQRV
jgi:hypothetical protein